MGDAAIPVKRKPAYLLHKATGWARVRFHKRDIYLGKYGSRNLKNGVGQSTPLGPPSTAELGVPPDVGQKLLECYDGLEED